MNPSAKGPTHRAIQLDSSGATPSRVCRTRPGFFLAPACFTSGSSREHQYTRPETVKQIQRSEACFYILPTTHLYAFVIYKVNKYFFFKSIPNINEHLHFGVLAQMSQKESRRDVCGMAMPTKCSRVFSVRIG